MTINNNTIDSLLSNGTNSSTTPVNAKPTGFTVPTIVSDWASKLVTPVDNTKYITDPSPILSRDTNPLTGITQSSAVVPKLQSLIQPSTNINVNADSNVAPTEKDIKNKQAQVLDNIKSRSTETTKPARGTNGKRVGMYDFYFTASDCNVYLINPLIDRKIQIDKAIGIGWSQTISSSPIYTLGNSEPSFFSRGNSLVQGSIELAFKSTEYMGTAFKYLTGRDALEAKKKELMNDKQEFTSTEAAYLYTTLEAMTTIDSTEISLSNIDAPLNIEVVFDNSNELSDSSTSSNIIIKGVKFISSGTAIHSGNEQALTYRYAFMAKNVG